MVDQVQVHMVHLEEDLAGEGPVAELLEWVEVHILAVEADNLLEMIILYSLHNFIQIITITLRRRVILWRGST